MTDEAENRAERRKIEFWVGCDIAPTLAASRRRVHDAIEKLALGNAVTVGDYIALDIAFSHEREFGRNESRAPLLHALRLAEPALRTLRDGHCSDECDCAYTKALNAIVAVLR